MSFNIDKQSQQDLNLFDQKGKKSVYGLFNQTKTKGGASLLEEIFRYPHNDQHTLECRLKVIKLFGAKDPDFPFDLDIIDAAELYLLNTDTRTQLVLQPESFRNTLKSFIGTDVQNQQLIRGIKAVSEIILKLKRFLNAIQDKEVSSFLYDPKSGKGEIWHQLPESGKFSQDQLVQLDRFFRFENREAIKLIFHAVYQIDVYLATARVAKFRELSFPVILPADNRCILITGMFHPLVENAVPNNVFSDSNSNIMFLTGANMAGKSTFMKAFGIAVFLAHIGFPVPAVKMEFSIQDGLYTTINLPDNITNGYSHFYAEVNRVKMVAEQLKLGKNLVIIFDELFRGTNVKDAHDATVAITSALSKKANCTFLVSTHIMEAGEILGKEHSNIDFIFLPTILKDNIPTYTYRISKGISDDRQGMMIIKNEGILEILNSRKFNS